MKKNKIVLIATVAIISIITSCKKSNDYYISPNSPSTLTPAVLLSATEVGTMNTFEGELARVSSILIQQNAGALNQAQSANFYGIKEDEYDNQWSQIYQSLENAKQLKENFGTKNPYYGGIAQIMTAMNFAVATDLWGDVPFSEALKIKEGILNPKFDSQEQILNGIINILDNAIVDLSKPATANSVLPGTDDIIFNGDVSLWIKTAHTLKARYLNRFSNKSNYDKTKILAELALGITANDENMNAIHGEGSAQNQWYAYQNGRAYIVAAAPFVDSIALRANDLRLNYYFLPNDSGEIAGSPIDNNITEVNVSYWGPYLAKADNTPFPIVTYAEAKFIEAEVTARNGGDASTILNDAIKASCEVATAGTYDGVNIATYTSANTDVSRIMFEKWIALFGNMEAYNDYRRTGYPALTPNPDGELPIIPKRLPTPLSERTGNTNSKSPLLTVPVWYGL